MTLIGCVPNAMLTARFRQAIYTDLHRASCCWGRGTFQNYVKS